MQGVGEFEEALKQFIKDKGVQLKVPVVSPAQKTLEEMLIFFRKYSTNKTLPIAAFASIVTFTLSYFTASALISEGVQNKSINGYIVTMAFLSSLFILSFIFHSWYRTIAKDKEVGNKLLSSDINKGEIETIKVTLDFNKGKVLEYIVPVASDQANVLIEQAKENRYRILLLSLPTVIPVVTLLAVLAVHRFNIENLYVGIPFIILSISVALIKLFFTLYKLKQNKIDSNNSLPRFSNSDILCEFSNQDSGKTIVSKQYQDEKEVASKKDVEIQTDAVDEYKEDSDVDSNLSSRTLSVYGSAENLANGAHNLEKTGSGSGWLPDGRGIGKGIAMAEPIQDAVQTLKQTCQDVSNTAEQLKQTGKDISEVTQPLKRMAEDVSGVTKQLGQTCENANETFSIWNQVGKGLLQFINQLDGNSSNVKQEIPIEKILPILGSNVTFKDSKFKDSKVLAISELMKCKAVVTYKNGSTLEYVIPATNVEKNKEFSNIFDDPSTTLHIESLNLDIDQRGLAFHEICIA